MTQTPKALNKSRAEDLATFVVTIGLSPSEYWALTVLERDAIIRQFNDNNKSS